MHQTMPLTQNARLRAHDLLRLRQAPSSDDAPAWLSEAFARAPFAVVRRAEASAGLIPVGLRGTTRAQRYGTWIEHRTIEAVHSPEALAQTEPARHRSALAPFAALRGLREAACLAEFGWGVTGSAGFELATGVPSVTDSSDLDLLVRTPFALPREVAHALHAALHAHAARTNVRIDVQLETPMGGVALSEWAANKIRVMVRSTCGPRLVADPWVLEAGTQRESL
jgi:phosphoribosyl-dephospho-CoA transferase